MKRKRHTPQEVIAKLREAEVDLNQGATNRGDMPEVGDQRTDLSSVAAFLRRDEGAGDGPCERAGE